MPAWTRAEQGVIERFLDRGPRVVTNDDCQRLADQLPNGTIPGIKAKILRISRRPGTAAPRPRSGPEREEDSQDQRRPRRPNPWTEAEVRRVAIRYTCTEANEKTKEARMQKIAAEFPGRSAKASTTKLSRTYPDI